jgi:hypothetical protein
MCNENVNEQIYYFNLVHIYEIWWYQKSLCFAKKYITLKVEYILSCWCLVFEKSIFFEKYFSLSELHAYSYAIYLLITHVKRMSYGSLTCFFHLNDSLRRVACGFNKHNFHISFYKLKSNVGVGEEEWNHDGWGSQNIFHTFLSFSNSWDIVSHTSQLKFCMFC